MKGPAPAGQRRENHSREAIQGYRVLFNMATTAETFLVVAGVLVMSLSN